MSRIADQLFAKFEAEVRAEAVDKIRGSAYVVAIAPDADLKPDIKQAIEIGLCILMEKPLIVLAPEGRHVCQKLLRIADYVVTGDVSTKAGRDAMYEKLRPILEQ